MQACATCRIISPTPWDLVWMQQRRVRANIWRLFIFLRTILWLPCHVKLNGRTISLSRPPLCCCEVILSDTLTVTLELYFISLTRSLDITPTNICQFLSVTVTVANTFNAHLQMLKWQAVKFDYPRYSLSILLFLQTFQGLLYIHSHLHLKCLSYRFHEAPLKCTHIRDSLVFDQAMEHRLLLCMPVSYGTFKPVKHFLHVHPTARS